MRLKYKLSKIIDALNLSEIGTRPGTYRGRCPCALRSPMFEATEIHGCVALRCDMCAVGCDAEMVDATNRRVESYEALCRGTGK